MKLKSLGHKLHQIRSQRVIADYKIHEDVSRADAAQMILSVESFIDTLNEFEEGLGTSNSGAG